MQRTAAGIEYTLTYKKVKNMNLRVTQRGVMVSAPRRVRVQQVDDFVTRHAAWIMGAQQRMGEKLGAVKSSNNYSYEKCENLFLPIVEKYYPLFAEKIGSMPQLCIKRMVSRWGTCNRSKHCITLSTLLMEKPMAAIEYVVLHEYVHFLYPDHQSGFHAAMQHWMPDYKKRRALLR